MSSFGCNYSDDKANSIIEGSDSLRKPPHTTQKLKKGEEWRHKKCRKTVKSLTNMK